MKTRQGRYVRYPELLQQCGGRWLCFVFGIFSEYGGGTVRRFFGGFAGVLLPLLRSRTLLF